MPITIGLEVEMHDIEGVTQRSVSGIEQSIEGDAHDVILRETKIARVIKELGLRAELQFDDPIPYLCTIRKRVEGSAEYADFLSVSFDDVASKGKLEFASIGSGILDHNHFLSIDNLKSIRAAINEFPAAIAPSSTQAAGTAAPEFQYNISEHARILFANKKLIVSARPGAVHVTHTLDTEVDTRKFLNFCKSSREESIIDMPHGIDMTTRQSYSNSSRSTYSPNSKTPRELIPLVAGLNAQMLCPMSNVVKDARNDLEIYHTVSRMISTKITSEETICSRLQPTDERYIIAQARISGVLTRAQAKLNRTAEFVGAHCSGKSDNAYICNSFEYRLQPPLDEHTVLVEHRSGPLVKFVEQALSCKGDIRIDRRAQQDICKALDQIIPQESARKRDESYDIPLSASSLVASSASATQSVDRREDVASVMGPITLSTATLPQNIVPQVSETTHIQEALVRSATITGIPAPSVQHGTLRRERQGAREERINIPLPIYRDNSLIPCPVNPRGRPRDGR